VNFGCGSVIVNYDGYAKHRTRVGDAAFVGCNVNLLAPVEVAARSFTAAGSTISLDVPEDALGVARARQRNIEGWVARKEGRGAARVATAKPKRSAKKRAAKKKTAKNRAAKRRPAKQAGRKHAPKRKAAHKRR
jgi:serine acetyltransferase